MSQSIRPDVEIVVHARVDLRGVARLLVSRPGQDRPALRTPSRPMLAS